MKNSFPLSLIKYNSFTLQNLDSPYEMTERGMKEAMDAVKKLVGNGDETFGWSIWMFGRINDVVTVDVTRKEFL